MSLIEKRFLCQTKALNEATTSEGHYPLLLLHGVTRRWQSFLRVADSLAVRYQLHALDFRGHGKSDCMPGKYRVVDYAEDAVNYVHGRLNPPAVVYGHSLGAMVAAIAAAECGDRVAGVILEDPPFDTMGRNIGESALLSLFMGFQQLAGDSRTVPEIAHALADVTLEDPKTQTNTRLGDVRDAAALRFTASCLKQLDPEVLDPIIAGEWLAGFDARAVMQRVNCPVLLLQAEIAAGGMLTDSDVDRIKSWTDDLVHVRFPGCGHVIHWDRTEELLSAVHSFLGALDL